MYIKEFEMKIILDDLGGPNVITRFFVSENRRQESQKGGVLMEAEVKGVHLLPQAKEWRQPIEAGREKETGSPLELPEDM